MYKRLDDGSYRLGYASTSIRLPSSLGDLLAGVDKRVEGTGDRFELGALEGAARS
jgi:hypothetical protein